MDGGRAVVVVGGCCAPICGDDGWVLREKLICRFQGFDHGKLMKGHSCNIQKIIYPPRGKKNEKVLEKGKNPKNK